MRSWMDKSLRQELDDHGVSEAQRFLDNSLLSDGRHVFPPNCQIQVDVRGYKARKVRVVMLVSKEERRTHNGEGA